MKKSKEYFIKLKSTIDIINSKIEAKEIHTSRLEDIESFIEISSKEGTSVIHFEETDKIHMGGYSTHQPYRTTLSLKYQEGLQSTPNPILRKELYRYVDLSPDMTILQWLEKCKSKAEKEIQEIEEEIQMVWSEYVKEVGQ